MFPRQLVPVQNGEPETTEAGTGQTFNPGSCALLAYENEIDTLEEYKENKIRSAETKWKLFREYQRTGSTNQKIHPG